MNINDIKKINPQDGDIIIIELKNSTHDDIEQFRDEFSKKNIFNKDVSYIFCNFPVKIVKLKDKDCIMVESIDEVKRIRKNLNDIKYDNKIRKQPNNKFKFIKNKNNS